MDELGFGITLALKDLFTSNAGKIERAYKSLDGTIASSSESISRNLDRIKQGAMLVGVGLAIMSIPSVLIASTMDVQKALGQMRSLGVKDLEGLALTGREFSNQWAGTTTAEFITASANIKQGIHGLSCWGIAGIRDIQISYADRLDGDSLKTHMILLGGPDANIITREVVQRVNSTLKFGDPDQHIIALYDSKTSKQYLPKKIALV